MGEWSGAAVWALMLGASVVAIVRTIRYGATSFDNPSLFGPTVRDWIYGESGWLGRKRPTRRK